MKKHESKEANRFCEKHMYNVKRNRKSSAKQENKSKMFSNY